MRTTVISPWFDEALNRDFTKHQVSTEGKEILTYYTTQRSSEQGTMNVAFFPHPNTKPPNLPISLGWDCVTSTPAGDISMTITHRHTFPHGHDFAFSSSRWSKQQQIAQSVSWHRGRAVIHLTLNTHAAQGLIRFPSRCVVSSYPSRKNGRKRKKGCSALTALKAGAVCVLDWLWDSSDLASDLVWFLSVWATRPRCFPADPKSLFTKFTCKIFTCRRCSVRFRCSQE